MSTYSESHRKYYEANKERILERYKETKPYKSFYERNKERIKERALARYYAKKLAAELATTAEVPGSACPGSACPGPDPCIQFTDLEPPVNALV